MAGEVERVGAVAADHARAAVEADRVEAVVAAAAVDQLAAAGARPAGEAVGAVVAAQHVGRRAADDVLDRGQRVVLAGAAAAAGGEVDGDRARRLE